MGTRTPAQARIGWGAGSAVALAALTAVAGGAGVASATQPVEGSHKVTYCHATHSEKNPYVTVTTDKVAVVRAHERHQDDEDVIPAFWYTAKDGTLAYFAGNNAEAGLPCLAGEVG